MLSQQEQSFWDFWGKIEAYSVETDTPIHQVVNVRQAFDEGYQAALRDTANNTKEQ